MQTELTVKGMMCDACAGHVERAVKSLPGVDDVTVDRAAKRVVVEYDAAKTTPADMVAAIVDEGYVATPLKASS
jgi:copper chaperone CopZ